MTDHTWQWTDPEGDRSIDFQPSDIVEDGVNIAIYERDPASDERPLSTSRRLALGLNLTQDDALNMGLELIKLACTFDNNDQNGNLT